MAPLLSPPSPPSQRESAEGKQPLLTGIPSNCLLSSALRQLPRFSPFPRPLPARPARPDAADLNGKLRTLHAPLASVAELCVRALGDAAAGNAFLAALLSIPANFQRFCQMHCRRSICPNSLSAHNFAAILPGDSVAGLVVANGITNFLNIYNTLLIVRILFTWFPNAPPAIVSPLSALCDPYLNIFRGIIPPLGGALDLSPILAFLVLNAFQSTAAALPAELPPTGGSQPEISASPTLNPMPFGLTTVQEKWMRRICHKRSRNHKDTKQTTE